MDIRTMIIQKVMEALRGRADEGILGMVQDTLVMELNNYEVLERCTEVAAMHLQEYLGSRQDDCEALFVGKGKRLKKNGIETVIKKLGKRQGWRMSTRTDTAAPWPQIYWTGE